MITWRELIYLIMVAVAVLTWRLNEIDKQETKRMKIRIQHEGVVAARELSAQMNRASTLFEMNR